MRVMQGWIKPWINLLGYCNKCHNITYPWPPSPLIGICWHLCTHIPVGTLGIGLLHKQQWLCLWWVMSWQSSAHSTAGRGGHERTVCPVTIPESCSGSCAESAVLAGTTEALFWPRGTCCSCCWWVSRWEVWKLKAVVWWSNIWALGSVAGGNDAQGYPGGPVSSSCSADRDWAAVSTFSCVTAGQEWTTVVSPALYTGVWVCLWVCCLSWVYWIKNGYLQCGLCRE